MNFRQIPIESQSTIEGKLATRKQDISSSIEQKSQQLQFPPVPGYQVSSGSANGKLRG